MERCTTLIRSCFDICSLLPGSLGRNVRGPPTRHRQRLCLELIDRGYATDGMSVPEGPLIHRSASLMAYSWWIAPSDPDGLSGLSLSPIHVGSESRGSAPPAVFARLKAVSSGEPSTGATMPPPAVSPIHTGSLSRGSAPAPVNARLRSIASGDWTAPLCSLSLARYAALRSAASGDWTPLLTDSVGSPMTAALRSAASGVCTAPRACESPIHAGATSRGSLPEV